MKNTIRFTKNLLLLILLVLVVGCTTEELQTPVAENDLRIGYRDNNDCSTVALTYPATVNVDETFSINAAVECGRVALDIGYMLVEGDTVYTGLTCATEDLQWKGVANFECYTDDLSVNQTLSEPGTYVYRSKHSAADGNCDNFNPPGPGNPGECTDFNGVNFCCFMIEAVESCADSLTAEVSCVTDEDGCNRHVTFTFTAEEAGLIVIQGGLTAFTEICSATATGGLVLNPTHPSAGGPSNVTRWEGEVSGDCAEYTITIHWTSTNNDTEITGRWSAKRGEVELAYLDPLTCE